MFLILSHSPAIFIFLSRIAFKRLFKDRLDFQSGLVPYVIGLVILGLSALPIFMRIKNQHERSQILATQLFVNWYETHALAQIKACNELDGKVFLSVFFDNGKHELIVFEDFLAGKNPFSAPEIIHIFQKTKESLNLQGWPSAYSCEFWNVAINSKTTQESRELREFFRGPREPDEPVEPEGQITED